MGRHGCVPSCVLVRQRQASPSHARRAGTRYTVFVARKQWGKIAEALAADAEDAAIIEGYAALDPRVEGIAVYATSATTKRLQAAKRVTTAATP
jgi:molybdopterin-guanine dinucleotide biosynthesis protein